MRSVISYIESLLLSIDIYGQRIELNFQKQRQYKTLFGGILSLLLFSIFFFGCWFYGKELILKQNPTVISSQRHVTNAQRITFQSDSLIFMVAVANHNNIAFKDPSLFNVIAVQETSTSYTDPVTGRNSKILVQNPIEMRPCTQQDIDIPSISSYFQQIDIPNFYCFGDDQSVFMEGEFDSQNFSQIYLYIEKCNNSTFLQNCKSPHEIDASLQSANILMYLSNMIIDPVNFDNPLSNSSMYLSSSVSSMFPKELQVYWTNQYIESDTGVFFESIETQRGYIFTDMKETTYFNNPNCLVRILLAIQMQTENLMQRRYLRVADIVAEIGGLLKVLTTLGTLLTFPISKLYLFKAIIDEVFQFEGDDDVKCVPKSISKDEIEQKEFAKSSAKKKSKGGNTAGGLTCISEIKEKTLSIDKSVQQRDFDKQQNQDQSLGIQSIFSSVIPTSLQSPSSPAQTLIKINVNQSIKEPKVLQPRISSVVATARNYFIQTHKIIKYTFAHFFTHIFLPKLKYIKKKRQLVEEGVNQLEGHLDVLFILNKLLEIDKIKAIIFNENQLKLFEYIPKPLISNKKLPQNLNRGKSSITMNQSLCDESSMQSPIKHDLLEKSKLDLRKSTIYQNSHINNKRVYSFYQNQKSDLQIALDAYEGLSVMFSQNKFSKIDENLIALLDQSLLQQIQQYTQFPQSKSNELNSQHFINTSSQIKPSPLKYDMTDSIIESKKNMNNQPPSLRQKRKFSIKNLMTYSIEHVPTKIEVNHPKEKEKNQKRNQSHFFSESSFNPVQSQVSDLNKYLQNINEFKDQTKEVSSSGIQSEEISFQNQTSYDIKSIYFIPQDDNQEENRNQVDPYQLQSRCLKECTSKQII